MNSSRIPVILAAIAISLPVPTGTSLAADPPDLVNYQGVLRDADDAPLDGSYDMVFRFFNAEGGGEEILIDGHTAADGAAVTVSGGLFNVRLGGGGVSDGSGPGVYDTLGEVFAEYSEVWLAIQVGGETLSPRVRVASSPYAANAMHLGGKKGDQFLDTTSARQSKLGELILGQLSGLAATHGVEAYGISAGGYFKDTDGSGYARVGYDHYGIRASGDSAGGLFEDGNGSGYAYVGIGSRGINAYGDTMGGYFQDSNSSGHAYVGHGDRGLSAYGATSGGFFQDSDSSGYAYAGHADRGISAYGNSMGGFFEDSNSSGYAHVGDGDYGILAYGEAAGGYFKDSDSSAYAHVAIGDRGISAHGDVAGGYFKDGSSSGEAYVGYGDWGIHAWGHTGGGYFVDSSHSGYARVGYGDRGIWAKGEFAGGTFSHPDSVTHWADVSTSTQKIIGTGAVSFVQNHPYEKDKVIVYAAPEGDEVATYTRGTARLIGGEARVPLGETFAWVTNPDIGLTAHLTARDPCRGLYVASLTTDEIIVREQNDGTSDALFDYFVFGLRIGFEEHAAVQVKDREAFLPASGASEKLFAEHPELKHFSALERFKGMQVALGESTEIDLARAAALIAAIDENREDIIAAAAAEAEAERAAPAPETIDMRPGDEARPGASVIEAPSPAGSDSLSADPEAVMPVIAETELETEIWLPVAEPVETGDVLVVDKGQPGLLRRCASTADPSIIGVAARSSREAEGGGLEAPMAMVRYAWVKVDAGYGAIGPGDLLVASPTPGHAMQAMEAIPGTIAGKAVDSRELGMGLIRVLLVTR